MEGDAVSPSPVVAKQKKKSLASSKNMTIKLKEWSSDASYIKALKGVKKSELLSHYFVLRKNHKLEASFYVDMADYFHKKGLKKEALLILSNVLELDFEKSEFIRVFAFKLLEHKWYTKSIFFFKKVQELRPFELQSTRDLALAYERIKKYQKALDLHYAIITKLWDGRFSGAKIVSINELNHLIEKYKLNTSKIDRRLIARMPVDIRIVINWSTDNTDMDLWVIDPKDEKTYYANNTSRIGGKISNDMTRGYGPEEFMLKRAIHGKYEIKVKYYASSQQKLTGPTVIRAEVYTKYGKKNEQREEIVFRVEEEKEVIDLGSIVY
jgi:tetratricopeptide (TPR) repeat protein